MKQLRSKKVILLLILSLLINIVPCYRVYAADNAIQAIEEYKSLIIASARKTGVWASVTAAQMIQECANPFGTLEKEGNNFFGIKWSESHATRYPGATYKEYSTSEYSGTSNHVTIKAKFTHFPSVEDGITEHSIIWWNGMYEPELKILENLNSTMDEFLKEMSNGPYCTDANYYNALKSHIKKYNLEELDKLAFPEGRKFCGFGDRTVGEYKYPNDGYNGSASNAGSTSEENGVSYVIVKESELEGMYPESFFLNDSKDITLPSYDDLSTGEKVTLDKIKENIELQNSWSIWDTVRVMTVFAGLCILIYAVVFIAGFLFDKSNNIIELSLISILTLGNLEYSDEETETRGYVNKSRLIKIEIALFLIGFFLVGGGLFSFIIDVMWYTSNIFG